jgi:hypothetical protein
VIALLGRSDVGTITQCTPDCAGAGVVSLGVRPEGALSMCCRISRWRVLSVHFLVASAPLCIIVVCVMGMAVFLNERPRKWPNGAIPLFSAFFRDSSTQRLCAAWMTRLWYLIGICYYNLRGQGLCCARDETVASRPRWAGFDEVGYATCASPNVAE